MITVFSVRRPARRHGIGGWMDKLKRDRVEVQTAQAQGVTLRHVLYTSYSGEVKLEKTDAAVGAARSRLLCSDTLLFPPHSGYRRFCSLDFAARLCENFALSVLDACPDAAGRRVALYDPEAQHADYLLSLLERCGDVTVVTDCAYPYYSVASRALEELGAAATVTRQRGVLENRALIIAPQPVYEDLPLGSGTVVLTVEKPRRFRSNTAFWEYHFDMPDSFSALKPDALSAAYFCSALYTLGGQYALGSILPYSAAGERTMTAAEIAAL